MYEQNIQMGIQGVLQLDGKIDKDTNLEAIQELNRIFTNLSQDLREGIPVKVADDLDAICEALNEGSVSSS